MSDLMQQVEADADSLSNLSDLSTDALSSVADLAENIKLKEDEVFQLEEKLKQAKKDLLKMTDEDLPMIMEEINLQHMEVQSRLTIGLKHINGSEIMVLEILLRTPYQLSLVWAKTT